MLVFKYILFAVIATAINLICQWVVFSLYEGLYVLWFALLVGTLAGLIAKYILDKHWIFYDVTTTGAQNIQKFGLYSLMGVVTTVIFWGTEMLFYTYVPIEHAQYLGGVIGLAIGYIVKYWLDKKYVFQNAQGIN